jgi:hypothetical protein
MSITATQLAVLAMDVYHRTENESSSLSVPYGAAEFTRTIDEISFSATAYVIGDNVVIAYRGTDNLLYDALTGWPAAFGAGDNSPQVVAAMAFYEGP